MRKQVYNKRMKMLYCLGRLWNDNKEKILKLFDTSRDYIFPAKILPQNYAAKQTVRIATMAAVAMCESIEAVSDEKAEING